MAGNLYLVGTPIGNLGDFSPRAAETLRSVENESPTVILQAVNNAVNEFVGDAVQFDDLTMLCVHYKGNE